MEIVTGLSIITSRPGNIATNSWDHSRISKWSDSTTMRSNCPITSVAIDSLADVRSHTYHLYIFPREGENCRSFFQFVAFRSLVFNRTCEEKSRKRESSDDI